MKLADEFFSDLHRRYLKAKGYRKQRHTFTRAHPHFAECVQFQGSAWNDSSSPWRFYVNVGVQFRGLPPRVPDRDLPGTHCWARIESIVPGAPAQFELGGENDQVAADLAQFVESASQRLAQHVAEVRERYEQTGSAQLSVN